MFKGDFDAFDGDYLFIGRLADREPKFVFGFEDSQITCIKTELTNGQFEIIDG